MQNFSIAPLRKVRQYIRKNFQKAEEVESLSSQFFLDDDADVPEPDSLGALSGIFSMGGVSDFDMEPSDVPDGGAWAISGANPADVLFKFPGLSLKPKFRLVAFTFQKDADGKGIVWAIPEACCTTEDLERALQAADGVKKPPYPAGALADVMGAIEGDRSPVSFFIASIFRRELLEFGAKGSFQNWTHHRLIEAVPSAIQPHWKKDYPQSLRPSFRTLADGKVVVEFFTCRVEPPVMIVRHIDQYPPQGYSPISKNQVLIKFKVKT
ncbi:MAG: hypothetical protein VKL39_05000 [Leptolyngbyaceae bacterium]|nr:hypothetical protein [Leptolyngbyaceae bacterium]